MKKQIGIWISADLWQLYRDLCTREKLRPAEAVESFLRFVKQGGSVRSVLAWLDQGSKLEGFEAYVKVLLRWRRRGERWIHGPNESEVSISFLLLEALKTIADPQLRSEVQEALKTP